ncbi:MAG: acetyl-CoA carboxylase biotin carboxylase subunit [Xanthomonadaceae bacterium]|nr:acetyl-CoA carboxylase biotin carboxylase subunit [Xanthomonadaceae bacterium]
MAPKQFKKILIANRGEIALRVIRACKEMGISTVAVYSQSDESSLHVKLADEAVCIGPSNPKDSYLNVANIITAADVTGADAIHPGYGFLSENADFAKQVEECGITFIGPNPAAIAAMGEKIQAKRIAQDAGVPLLAGGLRAVSGLEDALKEASHTGYPVMLKAAAGGGGRGIHVVYTPKQLTQNFDRIQTEVSASFKSKDIYIEKYIAHPRHVEIQVLCDKHGNLIHLGERDCTVQRRHQKIIEESPSSILTESVRKKMGEASLALCKLVNYDSVGTVEFLIDQDTGKYYFMEMNTRIQVEHTVTEMVTGIDLIKEQINVAAGFPLTIKQSDVRLGSCAIECRINAEDSVRFIPSPGLITGVNFPGGFGVRVDSFIYTQYKVVPYYDSLVAKLICHAPTRQEAIAKMRQALDEFVIEGIKSNLDLHRQIMRSKLFKEGDFDTHFLEEFLPKYE